MSVPAKSKPKPVSAKSTTVNAKPKKFPKPKKGRSRVGERIPVLPPNIRPTVLPTKAACGYVVCGYNTLEKYRKQGRVESFLHGRHRLYTVASLDALLDSLREAAA